MQTKLFLLVVLTSSLPVFTLHFTQCVWISACMHQTRMREFFTKNNCCTTAGNSEIAALQTNYLATTVFIIMGLTVFTLFALLPKRRHYSTDIYIQIFTLAQPKLIRKSVELTYYFWSVCCHTPRPSLLVLVFQQWTQCAMYHTLCPTPPLNKLLRCASS